MRTSVLTLSLALGLALQASPAAAASSSSLSFSGRYTSTYTQWSTSSDAVATTHSESATKSGAVRAEATAVGDRPFGWSAISAGTVSQSATVGSNPVGYRVDVTFTGISAASTGSGEEGNIGTAPANDTVAALGVGVRLSGECTSAAPCNDTRHVVSKQHDTLTVSVTYPAVAARSTMIVRASAQAWLRTPTADGAADRASIGASVASIRITPLG